MHVLESIITSTKMRNNIFHIISKFDIGGAEKIALNICKSRNKNIQYHLFEVFRTNSLYREMFIKEAIRYGIMVHQSPFKNRKLGIILFPFVFIFYYLKFKPTVIHTHTEVPDMAIFLFCKLFNPKSINVRTIHSTKLWNDWNRLGNRIETFYQNKNCNIAISESVRDSYVKKYGVSLIPIIYNGIDEVKQIPYTEIKSNKINILFAGRFSYEKGIDTLISVLDLFKNKENLYFHIIGSGDKEKEIYERFHDCNNVCIKDKIYNLSSYIGSFDYVLVPSLFEGLGLISLEASLSKVPVIINNCAGLNETIPDDWPLKVDNNSINGYKTIISSLTKYDKVYLGNIAYNYVKTNFSVSNMQEKYEKRYNGLL